MILQSYRLAALGRITALIRGLPGPRGGKRIAAAAHDVGHGANDNDGNSPAGVRSGRRIETPIAGAFHGFARQATNGRRRMVFHRHGLAAL